MTEPRFKTLTPNTMTPDQRSVAEAIVKGPRGGMRGPFNALLRSPGLADAAQKLGEHVRFKMSLPAPLRELAILLTARHWTAQYEWYAHNQIAREAGLAPAICEAIAEGKKPAGMSADEAIVYAFCSELLGTTQISDATFAKTRERFGEAGVMELTGTCGYYSLVAMVLNVDRQPIPAGAVALKPLR
jgi:4-carboxymuconolactone decarboxylase